MRDVEKKLTEEKTLRETAETKVKVLRKALREVGEMGSIRNNADFKVGGFAE